MKKIAKFISKVGLVILLILSSFVAGSPDSVDALSLGAITDPTINDRVTVQKEAHLVAGKVNTWDISLQVKSLDIVSEKTTNVVLVLDISGSMRDYMSQLRTAAVAFVNTFMNKPNVRIGLVTFSTGVTNYSGLGTNGFAETNDQKTTLINTINGLTSQDFTFTQGGIYNGKLRLDAGSADNEIMVLFSDGEPNRRFTGTHPNYNYGGAVTSNPDAFLAGVHAAGLTKSAGYQIHSIGFRLPNQQTINFLQDVSSGIGYYHAANDTNISETFANLATQIDTDFGIDNGQVLDILGPGFSLVPGSINTNLGSANISGSTITWNIGKMNNKVAPSQINYATLTYRVEINDSILGVAPDGNLYPTNTSAVLTDLNEPAVTRTFPIPKVDPVFIKVTKELVDQNSNVIIDSQREFDVAFAPAFNSSIKVKAGASETKILTSLRDVANGYTVTETGSNDGIINDGAFSDYAISYMINGAPGSTFNVNASSSVTQSMNDINVVIKNLYTVPHGNVVATKSWSGGNPLTRPSVQLQLYRKIGDGTPEPVGGVVTLDGSVDANELSPWVYTWNNMPLKTPQAKLYTYYVIETNAADLALLGYTPDQVNDLTVTNTFNSLTQNIVGSKVWDGGSTRPAVEFQLYRKVGAEVGELVGPPITLDGIVGGNELTSWNYTWTGLPTHRNSDGAAYIYYVKETNVPSSYIADGVDDLVVTNTYVPRVADVIANKVWVDGDADNRPDVKFQLYRRVGIEAPETVGTVVTLDGNLDANEMTSWHYTWTDLPTTRQSDGATYEYYVVETNAPFLLTLGYTSDQVNDLTVTNTYQPGLRTVSANKLWMGGFAHPTVEFQLKRSYVSGMSTIIESVLAPVALNGVIDGVPAGTNGEHAAWMYSWYGLPTHTIGGKLYTYFVTETTVPTNFTADDVDDLTVTNTYHSPLEDVVATKMWSGGMLRPEVKFQLYRKVGVEAGVMVGSEVALDGIVDANEKTAWNYTWKDLPTHRDADGLPYIYYVIETDIPMNYTPDLVNDLTVTNTYHSPLEDVMAHKTWVGGTLRPEVKFQLYRKVGVEAGVMVGSEVTLDGVVDANEKTAWNYTWKDLPTHRDADGLPYIYYVIETDIPMNYTPDLVNDLTVTNTYHSPLDDVVATKMWSGGMLRPEVKFQLYRKVGVEAGVMVGSEVALDGIVDANEKTAWNYTWKDLPTHRDADGLPYIYYVVETGVPTNYIPDVIDDLTVTNTFSSPLDDVVATKMWSGGMLRPEVKFQLYRKVGAEPGFIVGSEVTLDGIVDANELTAWNYTWKDLPTHRQSDGLPFIYYVVETDVPMNYTPDTTDDLVVTNTYNSPLIDVDASKVWVNGDAANRPSVTFQLYRKIEEEASIAVGGPVVLDGVVDANEMSAWVYTWKDLPSHRNSDGKEFMYYVVETVVPTNFTADDVDDLTVTNTYHSPLTDVMAEKVWSGGALRPEVTFQLYRVVGDEEPEAVGPEIELDGVVDAIEMTEWMATWEDLPTHRDSDAALYTYYVVEVDVPENYMPDDTDDLVVTNTFESPLADVVANKVWVGGALRPEVTFQLYRRVGTEAGVAVGSPVKLDGVIDANELTAWTYTWKSLPTHRQADGLAFVYYVIETGAVTNYVPDAVNDLTVTNTYVSPLIDVTMTKVWLNVTANFPTVQIQLFRNGVAHLAPVSLVNGATGYTWEDLAQFDPNGVAYVYTVDEVAVPTGYLKQVVGMQITNVFVVLPDTGGPKLPDTGTTDNTMYIIGGVSIALIGVLAIILVKRKKS